MWIKNNTIDLCKINYEKRSQELIKLFEKNNSPDREISIKGMLEIKINEWEKFYSPFRKNKLTFLDEVIFHSDEKKSKEKETSKKIIFLENINFKKDIHFFGNFNGIYLKDLNIMGLLTLSPDKISSIVSINSIFFKTLKFTNRNLQVIHLEKNTFRQNLIIDLGKKNEINLTIKSYENNYKDTVVLKNISGIKKLILTSKKTLNKLFIKDFKINNLDTTEVSIDIKSIKNITIQNFSNLCDDLVFSNILVNNFYCINSNLGKGIFYNFNVKNIFFISNSYISEIKFNNCKLPYEILSNYKKVVNSNSQMKDNYRQLKYVMDKNGNHTEANKFFAKEMLYYSRILGTEKTNIFSLFNSKFYGTQSEKVGEKISLAISEIISDYGSNLPRVIFVWGMYLFLAYLIVYITNYGQNLLSQSGIFFLESFQDTWSDLFSILLFLIISLPTSNYFEKKLNQLEKSKTFNRYFLYSIFAIFIGLSFMHVKDFKGIETFVFLLNPLSGFKESIIENFVWTEKIALLIHKVIFATFIYHFIITLRRTTKR